MSATVAERRVAVAAERKSSLHRQRMWALWGSYAALSVFVFMFLVPPFYTLMTSLKSSAEISAQVGSPWLVKHPTLENFWYLITYPNFQRYYLNSIMVTILTVAVSMVIAVLAAFSLSRMGFWGSSTLSTGVFLTYLVPPSLLFIRCSDHRAVGADQQLLVPGDPLPDAGGAVLYLDHDRLFQLDPARAG